MAVRVILDRYELPMPSYCWREAWVSRYESAYSLLSKFALLNALTATDLARLLVIKGKGLRTQMQRTPDLALHDAAGFDLSTLTILLHLPEQGAEEAFLLPALDPRDYVIHPNLRFCPRCLARGFHAAMFQLDIVTRCPIHGCTLTERCPHCKGLIPYRLQHGTFVKPYACVKCQAPLATGLYTGNPKLSVLDHAQAQRLGNVLELLRLKQSIFACAVDLDRHFALYDQGQLRIARPLLQRKKKDYLDFLDTVLSQWTRLDVQGRKDASDAVVWLQHSGFVPRPKAPPRRPPATLARRWYERDEKFWALMPIYKAVRRHLWRHVVVQHRACIYAAARALWWSPDRLTTPKICPVAYAFLQWRAFWEGFSAPQHLFLPPTHAPLRILAWLGDTAPFCPRSWPPNVQDWLTQRIFALDCSNSFDEWLGIAKRLTRRKAFDWSRDLCTGHTLTYWAATGKGRGDDSLSLAVEKRPPRPISCLPFTLTGRAHYQWHLEQIRQFDH